MILTLAALAFADPGVTVSVDFTSVMWCGSSKEQVARVVDDGTSPQVLHVASRELPNLALLSTGTIDVTAGTPAGLVVAAEELPGLSLRMTIDDTKEMRVEFGVEGSNASVQGHVPLPGEHVFIGTGAVTKTTTCKGVPLVFVRPRAVGSDEPQPPVFTSDKPKDRKLQARDLLIQFDSTSELAGR